jgi:hypothetical protein
MGYPLRRYVDGKKLHEVRATARTPEEALDHGSIEAQRAIDATHDLR